MPWAFLAEGASDCRSARVGCTACPLEAMASYTVAKMFQEIKECVLRVWGWCYQI